MNMNEVYRQNDMHAKSLLDKILQEDSSLINSNIQNQNSIGSGKKSTILNDFTNDDKLLNKMLKESEYYLT
jgi:hypothetical protein